MNNPSNEYDVRRRRLAYWGGSFLLSTEESLRRAEEFAAAGLDGSADHFTAYMYLFVAFNNLYALLGRSANGQKGKIEAAIDALDVAVIDLLYDQEYLLLIHELNDGPPEQLVYGPDKVRPPRVPCDGVVNMGEYLFGKSAANWIEHVQTVAPTSAAPADKVLTLKQVASRLLYTIRNNQFHAVKGAQNMHDVLTVELAYRLLFPIVQSLIPIAKLEVRKLTLGSADHD
jgi:hypothetical protein